MKIENGKEYNFHDCLYEAQCVICESKLYWSANFDADGTSYFSKCCNKYYWLKPSKVTAYCEDDTQE